MNNEISELGYIILEERKTLLGETEIIAEKDNKKFVFISKSPENIELYAYRNQRRSELITIFKTNPEDATNNRL